MDGRILISDTLFLRNIVQLIKILLTIHCNIRPQIVILGKQCLHVLSKGTALHKAVGC